MRQYDYRRVRNAVFIAARHFHGKHPPPVISATQVHGVTDRG